MGSAQSYISPEAAVTVAVVAGAIGLGYTQLAPSTSNPNSVSGVAPEGPQKKGKKKKQAKAGVVSGDISETGSASKSQGFPPPRVVAFPEVIPGQFDAAPAAVSDSPAQEATASSKSKKTKKKKGKAASAEPVAQPPSTVVDYSSETSIKAKPKSVKRPLPQELPPASSSKLTRPLQQSTTSIDTDGSWTRVGSHRHGPAANSADADSAPSAEPTTSDAGITPSVTGDSSPVAERADDASFLLTAPQSPGDNRRTLAEKLLPKPRKTGVDELRLFHHRIYCNQSS